MVRNGIFVALLLCENYAHLKIITAVGTLLKRGVSGFGNISMAANGRRYGTVIGIKFSHTISSEVAPGT